MFVFSVVMKDDMQHEFEMDRSQWYARSPTIVSKSQTIKWHHVQIVSKRIHRRFEQNVADKHLMVWLVPSHFMSWNKGDNDEALSEDALDKAHFPTSSRPRDQVRTFSTVTPRQSLTAPSNPHSSRQIGHNWRSSILPLLLSHEDDIFPRDVHKVVFWRDSVQEGCTCTVTKTKYSVPAACYPHLSRDSSC